MSQTVRRIWHRCPFSPTICIALSRVFSHTFHTNFNGYLNNLRLNQALNLLENSEDSITELAMEAGFTSMRTFNRVFGERYRMSPREYRKMRKNGGGNV